MWCLNQVLHILMDVVESCCSQANQKQETPTSQTTFSAGKRPGVEPLIAKSWLQHLEGSWSWESPKGKAKHP